VASGHTPISSASVLLPPELRRRSFGRSPSRGFESALEPIARPARRLSRPVL
jgi:hypothetical protein